MEKGELNQDQLIKELANKYKIGIDEAKKAINSQFHFTNEKMKNLHTIRLPFFGVFKPNHKKIKREQQRYEEYKKTKS